MKIGRKVWLKRMTYERAYEKAKEFRQEHILTYYQELTECEQVQLCKQIEELDFSLIPLALEQKESGKGEISPLRAMELEEIDEKRELYYGIGIEAIQAGKIAALMLAGGMGTRLGSVQPKGMYNIGIKKHRFIFECQISNLLEVVQEAGVFIPLYIMTSHTNHKETVAFFQEHDYFGYEKESVIFFVQEMAPTTDLQGKVLLEAKGIIASSPNGNGGWFASMDHCNLLEDLYEKGIEWINVFAVDNVLQHIADPYFIGATLHANSTVGAKVVRKASRDEAVGVICLEDGKPSIVEYYELTDELMDAVDEQGNPLYNFGVILNYLFQVDELKNMLSMQMPLHVVKKKIPYMNEVGEYIQPVEENGCKYETLALDMIHLAHSCLPFEVERNKEFAPIKNKEGKDSIVTARILLQENGIEL